MAVEVADAQTVKGFVMSDPLRNAVVAQRVFAPRERTVTYANSLERIRAVAAVEMPDEEGETRSLALAASDADALRDVLDAIPRGGYWIHFANEELMPVIRERMKLGWYDPAWLLAMDPKDLKGDAGRETRRIDVKWAHRIAGIWASDWNADNYVRWRLESGPSAGIEVDGELVGWGLTHFETDHVSMLGFMYILPEHRGKGYAESITADLVRQVGAGGRTPACHVYEENYQSLGLCERIGFRRVCRQVWGDAVTL